MHYSSRRPYADTLSLTCRDQPAHQCWKTCEPHRSRLVGQPDRLLFWRGTGEGVRRFARIMDWLTRHQDSWVWRMRGRNCLESPG